MGRRLELKQRGWSERLTWAPRSALPSPSHAGCSRCPHTPHQRQLLSFAAQTLSPSFSAPRRHAECPGKCARENAILRSRQAAARCHPVRTTPQPPPQSRTAAQYTHVCCCAQSRSGCAASRRPNACQTRRPLAAAEAWPGRQPRPLPLCSSLSSLLSSLHCGRWRGGWAGWRLRRQWVQSRWVPSTCVSRNGSRLARRHWAPRPGLRCLPC